MILLTVEPRQAVGAIEECRDSFKDGQFLVSVVTGIRVADLRAATGDRLPVVRVMPNIAASVGEGAAAICGGKCVQDEHIKRTKDIFNSVGTTIIIEEKLMDAVTGLSGSGPAFIFLIIEALADAGVQVGLSRQNANTLAIQTVLGASKMASQTDTHPAVLKNMVTSPGGTTAAGLYELERSGLRCAIADAVMSAVKRSVELRNTG